MPESFFRPLQMANSISKIYPSVMYHFTQINHSQKFKRNHNQASSRAISLINLPSRLSSENRAINRRLTSPYSPPSIYLAIFPSFSPITLKKRRPGKSRFVIARSGLSAPAFTIGRNYGAISSRSHTRTRTRSFVRDISRAFCRMLFNCQYVTWRCKCRTRVSKGRATCIGVCR